MAKALGQSGVRSPDQQNGMINLTKMLIDIFCPDDFLVQTHYHKDCVLTTRGQFMPTNSYTGIIDVYYANNYTIAGLQAAGVTAVLHKASEGTTVTDSKYASRKQAANQAGILWGAYHLTNGASAKKQINNFFSVESGADGTTLMALDWERSHDGTIPDIDGIRELVTEFNNRTGYYPMLYGGHTLRDTPEVVLGDTLLGKCPLWYQRYRWDPLGIPVRTWPTYTLWQFADEHRGFGSPPANVLPGADFNRFQGTAQELAAAWPFRGVTTPAGPLPPPELPRKYEVTASSLNVRTAPGIDSKVKGALKLGAVVPCLELNDDKTWMRTDDGAGLKGWCSLRWLRPLVGTPLAGEPEWMKAARGEIGVREVPGSGDNPRIVEYLQSTTLGRPDNQNDETPWCSAFANWCLEDVGMEGTNSAWARSWLNWGRRITSPVPGCVTVFSRGANYGHVGFFIEKKNGLIYVLGGNQSDSVCIDGYPESRLLGYRMNA